MRIATEKPLFLLQGGCRFEKMHLLKESDRPLLTLPLGQSLLRINGLCQLKANGIDRIERTHRFLEDHTDLATPNLLHLAGGQRSKSMASPLALAETTLRRG